MITTCQEEDRQETNDSRADGRDHGWNDFGCRGGENEWLFALPIDSCDCSTWLGGVRWNNLTEKAMGKVISRMGDAWGYVRGTDAASQTGSIKAVQVSAWCEVASQQNWHHHLNAFRRMGVALYPPAVVSNSPSQRTEEHIDR